MNLKVPRGCLVVAVLRDDDAFIPAGGTVFEVDDHIVLILLRDVVTDIELWLTREA